MSRGYTYLLTYSCGGGNLIYAEGMKMDVHTPRLIATVSYLYLKHMDSSLGLEGILTYPLTLGNPYIPH